MGDRGPGYGRAPGPGDRYDRGPGPGGPMRDRPPMHDRGPYDRGPAPGYGRPGGGYDRGPGGGGYDRGPGGGGYDRGPGGYDRGPGGYDRGRPVHDNRGPGGYGPPRGREQYDRGPGGYDRGPGGPPGGYRQDPRGDRYGGPPRGGGYDRDRPPMGPPRGGGGYDRGPRPGGPPGPRPGGPGGYQQRGPGGPGRPPQGGPGRPMGRPPGPGGPRGQAPRPPARAPGPPGGKVDKLHQEASEFARNFNIPEAVAFQIVRGDFTLKEWMEKHAEAERKRKERDKVLAVKKQQRARDEGMAQQYFLKQKRNETPLFFRTHGGGEIEGPIRSILPYHFWVDVKTDEPEPKREKIEKLNIVMCYKKGTDPEVRAGLKRDDEVAAMNIQAVREKEGRYEVPLAIVQRAAQDGQPLRAVLNEGTVVEGTVDWHSAYFIKVKLSTGASVVVFNHGVHKLDIAEVAGRK